MEFDVERVRRNVREATTEDLLDRITVYRAGMEPEALEVIEAELRRREVDADAIEAHDYQRCFVVIRRPDGTAMRCSHCHGPAVEQGWGWHWLRLMVWGERRRVLPLLPRNYNYCEKHRPGAAPED